MVVSCCVYSQHSKVQKQGNNSQRRWKLKLPALSFPCVRQQYSRLQVPPRPEIPVPLSSPAVALVSLLHSFPLHSLLSWLVCYLSPPFPFPGSATRTPGTPCSDECCLLIVSWRRWVVYFFFPLFFPTIPPFASPRPIRSRSLNHSVKKLVTPYVSLNLAKLGSCCAAWLGRIGDKRAESASLPRSTPLTDPSTPPISSDRCR